MRVKGKRFSSRHDELDPVALSLAIWLGLLASVAGIARLSETTALQSALTELRHSGPEAAAERPLPSLAAWSLAYGG